MRGGCQSRRLIVICTAAAVCVLAAVFALVKFAWRRGEPQIVPPVYHIADETIDEIVDALAEIRLLEWENDPNRIKARLPQLYETLSIERPAVLEQCLWLYRAQCLVRLSREQETQSITQQQLEKGTPDTPEFLNLEVKLSAQGRAGGESRVKAWNELGRILPLTGWGDSRDGRMNAGRGWVLIDPPPPSVPEAVDMQTIVPELAELYISRGYIEEAINAYLETFYDRPFVDSVPGVRGQMWLRVAELERIRGNKELAVRAYLKTARCWHEYAETAKQGIKETLAETKPRKLLGSKPRLTRDTAIRIASFYRKMNLHPIALSVLERGEADSGADLAPEKQVTEKEWASILDRITRSRGPDGYILGRKISEVKDWSKISILRPTDTFWK